MIFNADKQTLDDLNIFGKKGKESVYSLFNRTYTTGGAMKLEQIFHYPTTGETEIRDRSETIQYFCWSAAAFPLEAVWIEVMVAYLSDRDSRTLLRADGETMESKLNKWLGVDTQLNFTQKALKAIGECLSHLSAFLEKIADKGHNTSFQKMQKEVKAMLDDEEFRLAYISLNSKLSFEQMASFDRFFRFTHYEKLQTILEYVYWLDIYISVATVARERKLAFAEVLPGSDQQLEIKGFYHPLVPGALGNDIRMDAAKRVLFLTGANMAGKSTLMKSFGITVFLAHIGFPIPAASMKFTVNDGLYTTINLSDSIQMGHSHFYAEVLRVKKVSMELAAGKKLIIIFDELFRGTNVKDAHEATVAVTSLYSELDNSLMLVSTHIVEAADNLRERCNNIRYAYMPTVMKENTPLYTYVLTEGVTQDRHGMLIIQNEGILDILANGKKAQYYE
ncbi:MutS-related protein [Pseudoflavitalea rhizosphaerae]|uniref:MutS-related protein n=1 Tax=Pseudoflavitalea rhizosphaerae TaxID=1884793 RepID=UPI000F8DF556|nr:DNA mismatch repair protein [Pseudoflavitalea rhizosphaerae]